MIESILEPFVSERFRNEPSYREGHIRIINPLPGVRVLGLHIPDMKKIAKSLAVSVEAPGLLDSFEASAPESLCYEEKIIWGLMLDYHKCPLKERIARFKAFVPVIDCWSVCDCVCGAAKWASIKRSDKEGQNMLHEFLDNLWDSDREFEVRFAVIMSMSYLMDEIYLPEVFRKINAIDFSKINSDFQPPAPSSVPPASVVSSVLPGKGCCGILSYGLSGGRAGTAIGQPPYYVRMGVAWFLATALAKYPEMTRKFVRNCTLPEDVMKLYIRKSRESFRTRDISPI